MYTGSSSIHHVIIPANAPGVLVASGRYVQIVRALGPVLVKIDSTSEREFRAGQGERTDTDFGRLVFRFPDNSAGEIEVWVGYSEFIDRRVDQVEAPHFVKSALPDGILAAAQTLTLNGEPPTGALRRKAVQISNLDANIRINIYDEADGLCGIVRTGETITITGSGVFKIKSDTLPGGAAVNCTVCEYWYSL